MTGEEGPGRHSLIRSPSLRVPSRGQLLALHSFLAEGTEDAAGAENRAAPAATAEDEGVGEETFCSCAYAVARHLLLGPVQGSHHLELP